MEATQVFSGQAQQKKNPLEQWVESLSREEAGKLLEYLRHQNKEHHA